MSNTSTGTGKVNWTAAKAIWGGVSAALTGFLLALLPYLVDTDTLGEVSLSGWVVAILGGLGAGGVVGGAVYEIPNKIKSGNVIEGRATLGGRTPGL